MSIPGNVRVAVIFIGLLALLASGISGCAGAKPVRHAPGMKARLDRYLGQSKNQVVAEFGNPNEIQTQGAIDVLTYFFARGAAAGKHPLYYSDYPEDLETFRAVNLYFQKDRMIKWDSHVEKP